MLISPIRSVTAASPLVSESHNPVSTRNGSARLQVSQSGADAQPAIFVNQRAGEVKLSFPSDRAEEIESGLKGIEETVQAQNIELNISRDQDTGTIVVKFVDQYSGETVQQIPDEAMLRLSAMLGKLQGNLFDRKA
jgi:uncharacterized FlaG/YvyC family protein